MLETLKLVLSIHAYVISEYTAFNTETPITLLISTFLCKKSESFGKNSTFTQSNSMRAVLEIFSSVFSFAR